MAQGPESKFKFVSPGVFIDEIDNSQIIRQSDRVGPVIIGRTLRGPAMRPVQVQSFSEFVEIFGEPIPGGRGGDVWREGNFTAPTYAGYAAQAWLKNNSPLTVVRLLGAEHSNSTSDGKAGWDMGNVSIASSGEGGAYGLWVIDVANAATSAVAPDGTTGRQVTGALAAVFYLKSDYNIELTGTDSKGFPMSGGAIWMQTSSAGDFTAVISKGAGYTSSKKYTFSLNRNSYNYIRKVFNTNPTLTNTTITNTAAQENYFLGETFDRHVEEAIGTTKTHAIILGLASQNSTYEYADRQGGLERSQTGWFISQHLGETGSFNADYQQKLFRFKSIDGGEWNQNNLKISIQDILPASNKFNDYGSFTVAIRSLSDTDTAPKFVEKYTNCNLNPGSPNYVARKVGDRYKTWDETERRYRTYGNYANASKFIYVDMNKDVDSAATDARFLPFGVFGPERLRSVMRISGTVTLDMGAAVATAHAREAHESFGGHTNQYTSLNWGPTIFVKFNKELGRNAESTTVKAGQIYQTASHQMETSAGNTPTLRNMTCSLFFPALPLRKYADQGGTGPQTAYWGVTTDISGTTRFDQSIKDIVRRLPRDISEGGDYTEKTWLFTLDDVRQQQGGVAADNEKFEYVSGSRNGIATSPTATGSSYTALNGYIELLETKRVNKFTTLLHGGHDGLDITEANPFRNTRLDDARGDVYTNYAYNSVKRGIDSVADAEVVEYNLAALPGVTNTGLTEHLISVCESRGDALAIIDLEDDYVPKAEATTSDASRIGSVKSAVTSLNNRRINSSYACAFYPWVQIRDSLSNSVLWAPPSIAALGTFSFSERKKALWFAPAGFTRGGLTQGAAGIPVVGVRQNLTSKDRDRLYEANINPIATFPAEGIVIFGQKTLQVVPSALDRINVRRLMIYIKKEVSRMAATTLFEMNVQSTWNLFKAKIDTFLTDIKVGDGLTDFKVILDETTTTPELIDRNILYAKVFLKPARAIEFIALDFVITDSGASFAD